jgi:hypothetical protein
MIVLEESLSNQTFSFIPRSDSYITMTIMNETTKETVTVSIISSTNLTYYHTITALFDLKENNFYILKVLNGTDVVFIDKVFCTNQPIVTFSVNDGKYVSHSTSNEFIIYE